MTPNNAVFNLKERNRFWEIVEQCIRQFHPHVEDFLVKKEQLQKTASEIFYHSEPFDVACNLANNPLDVKKYLDEYLTIRDKNNSN